MAQEDVAVRLRLLNALKFKRDADASGKALEGVGTRARRSAKALGVMEAASTRTNRVLKAGLLTARRYSVLGLGAVGFSLHEVVHRAQEAETTMRRTNATIKSTHGVAHVTAAHIEKLSDSLGNYTDLNYEAIHQGENMILTFTKIRNTVGKGNNIFDRATKTVVGMTQAFHGRKSISAVAIQVGKALQDPARGVSALRRVGANFTVTQQQMINKWVKQGKLLTAQKYIIRELNHEFPVTRGTPWQRLITQFDKLQVILGKALIPYMDKATKAMIPLVKGFNDGVGEGGKFRDSLNHAGKTALKVADDLKPLLHVVEKYHKPLADVAGAWLAISVGMGAARKLSGPLGKLFGKGVGKTAGKLLGGQLGTYKNPMYVIVLNGKGGGGLPNPGNPGDTKAEESTFKKVLRRGKGVAKWVPEVAMAAASAAGAKAALTNRIPKSFPLWGGSKLTDNAFTFGHSTMPHPDPRAARATRTYGPNRWLTPAERSLAPALKAGLDKLQSAAKKGQLAPADRDIVIHLHNNLDGRQLTETVHRHVMKAKALR